MRKVNSAGLALFAAVALGGCGVVMGSFKMAADREFPLSEVSKVQPGMREGEVVELLGKPAAFGIDDQGCPYLAYNRTRQSVRGGMITGPGAGAVTASARLTGFEVRVYLRDGVVQSVGETLYQEAEEKKQ